MEFKRINKDTVTCIITEDDMFEQGIKLEDLFEKKKEAMDFLHEVMKKAEEEVDYKPTGAFMPMQITVLPDHSISLTLSENASASFSEILKNLTEKAGIQIPKNVLEDIGDSASEDRINRLNEYLKSLKQLTNSVKDMMSEDSDAKDDKKFTVNGNATVESAKEKADKISTPAGRKKELSDEEKNQRRLKFHEYIFEFDDLNTVIKFCKKAPKGLRISSSLYKNSVNGKYYLDLLRQGEEAKVFASLFTMAYEFGHFQASNLNVIAHIKENYDCIIKCNAIGEMASLDM
ncbi:adaptor protein MecA [Butyrivibrio sp. NC2007]|uniref:adaptor protein MecA n=1 Tax=Butyrivibrio sp. NC2007 TaxID=1280683 RepID=UPI0003B51E02|nr:adaptor protein MecA [Butyrivibrio sp. NC2007]